MAGNKERGYLTEITIAYLFGSIEAKIEGLATSKGLSKAELASGLSSLLSSAAGGEGLGTESSMPMVPSDTTERSGELEQMALAERSSSQVRIARTRKDVPAGSGEEAESLKGIYASHIMAAVKDGLIRSSDIAKIGKEKHLYKNWYYPPLKALVDAGKIRKISNGLYQVLATGKPKHAPPKSPKGDATREIFEMLDSLEGPISTTDLNRKLRMKHGHTFFRWVGAVNRLINSGKIIRGKDGLIRKA